MTSQPVSSILSVLHCPLGLAELQATPWSAEEMLDGQHQRVDIPAHARAAHSGLLQKCFEEDFCLIVPHVPPDDPIGQGSELNWNELNSRTGLSQEHLTRSQVNARSNLFCLFVCLFFDFPQTNVFSHWELSHGKFGSLFPGKAGCYRVALPNLRCLPGVLVFS